MGEETEAQRSSRAAFMFQSWGFGQPSAPSIAQLALLFIEIMGQSVSWGAPLQRPRAPRLCSSIILEQEFLGRLSG